MREEERVSGRSLPDVRGFTTCLSNGLSRSRVGLYRKLTRGGRAFHRLLKTGSLIRRAVTSCGSISFRMPRSVLGRRFRVPDLSGRSSVSSDILSVGRRLSSFLSSKVGSGRAPVGLSSSRRGRRGGMVLGVRSVGGSVRRAHRAVVRRTRGRCKLRPLGVSFSPGACR